MVGRCYEWEYATCDGFGNLTCTECDGISVEYQGGWVMRNYSQCQVGYYRGPCINRYAQSVLTGAKALQFKRREPNPHLWPKLI